MLQQTSLEQEQRQNGNKRSKLAMAAKEELNYFWKGEGKLHRELQERAESDERTTRKPRDSVYRHPCK